MRATLIDADGRTFEIGDFDLSRPLAEQRPDLASVAMPATLAYTRDEAPTFTARSVPAFIRRPTEPNNRWPTLEDVVTLPDPDLRRVFAPDPSPYRWPAADRPGARKQRRGR